MIKTAHPPKTLGPHRHNSQNLITRTAGIFKGALRELRIPADRRVPFLDALRALAVLLVVNGHVSADFAAIYGQNLYTRLPFTSDGWMGVDLFFVLSGFFIGSQLWRELDKTGTVSIANFMIRRGLRIWPLYFSVFIVVLIATWSTNAGKQHGWSDLVFLTNYLPYGIVQGSWSLCSEEHFYLLAPFLLFLIGKRSMRSYRWGLIGLLMVEVVVRGATYAHYAGGIFIRDPHAFRNVYYPFHTHCDGLIAGLLIANLVADRSFKGLVWAKPWLVVLAGIFTFAGGVLLQREILYFFGFAALFSSIIWFGLKKVPNAGNSHVFYLLSRLSFGMYLNHEYMGDFIVKRIVPALGLLHLGKIATCFASFLILAGLSAALSTISFCLIEHPFLVLRTSVLRRRVVSPLIAH